MFYLAAEYVVLHHSHISFCIYKVVYRDMYTPPRVCCTVMQKLGIVVAQLSANRKIKTHKSSN